MMQYRPIETTIFFSTAANLGTESKKLVVYLHTVPSIGEWIDIAGSYHQVKDRTWKLTEVFEGGRLYGHKQTCILTVA